MRTPERKPRRVFRQRGTAAEEKLRTPERSFLGRGKISPGLSRNSVERCRGRYTGKV